MRNLTPADRVHAWQLAYQVSADRLSNDELAWERDCWDRLGVPALVVICEAILRERAAANLEIPSDIAPRDLDRFWKHSNQIVAVHHVAMHGQALIAALRLNFWLERWDCEA
jgi:hypothetical protein